MYKFYSIVFTIHLCLETKLKEIIGFDNNKSYKFKFTNTVKVLKELGCLELPVHLDDMKHVYWWSSYFVHFGEKSIYG